MKNKNIFLIALVCLFFSTKTHAQLKYTINESWRFLKDSSVENIVDFKKQLDRAELVNLPHTWNDKDVVDEVKGYYRGAGWYTKTVRIPTAYKTKKVALFFEGANTVSDVYINNTFAGKHIGGYTRFVIPISKFITFDDEKAFTTFNIIVKVDNAYNDDVPVLGADFTFFGGIYRDVNLVVTNPIHFNFEEDASNGVFITTPEVSKELALVNLKLKLRNDSDTKVKLKLITKIYNPQDALIREESKSISLNSKVSDSYNLELKPFQNPQLWSPDTPNLYKVVSQIYDAKTNKKLDEVSNPLGFRWYKFDTEKGFFLNGEHLKLIGTNRHQDFKDIGNALPDYIHIEDVIKMKEMGSNFLRIAHYPQDPAILEMCDKLGILTTVEVPIVDTITESESFYENCLSAHWEMIRQNYNHPSLIIWAYMNEVLLHPRFQDDKERYKIYAANVVALAQKIENLTRKEDPYRYTMIPNHGNLERYKEPGLTDVPMIIGWNIYDGWYGSEYDALEERMYMFYNAVKKPIIITEYGAGADPRLHTLNPTRFDFTQEYATNFHNHYLTLLKSLPFISGMNVWNYADFNSEGRIDAVQSINNKGLLGLDRKPKDVYYYYQASLLKEPFIAIGAKTWGKRSNVEDEQGYKVSTMPVQVFTNQKSIELFHNGKSLGIQEPNGVIATFNVPFVNGENRLRAVSSNSYLLDDYAIVNIKVLPIKLDDFPKNGMSINVGDQRFFYDDIIDQGWMINRAYTKGSWGHVGGKPYVRPNKRKQQPYGAKETIVGTKNDPIYQTQLVGIEQFKFDVPHGKYEIKLHFAELEGASTSHLPYDLVEASTTKTKTTNRTFSVLINNKTVIDALDIIDQYGEFRAITIKHELQVQEGEGLTIDFEKIVGEPVLNAIEIYKKL